MASAFLQSAALNGNYDRLVGPELPQSDPSKIQAEVDELLAKTDQIRHHVDRRFAHYGTRGIQKRVPTVTDINSSGAGS